jgi:hypothetical protein
LRLYIDTSALVKLLVREAESERVEELWLEAARRFSSSLVHVEARSALARARRVKRLTQHQYAHAKRELDDLVTELDLIEVTAVLVRHAGEIAERYRLRAYDAIHLASSLALDEADLVVATWDAELRRVIPEAGLALAA